MVGHGLLVLDVDAVELGVARGGSVHMKKRHGSDTAAQREEQDKMFHNVKSLLSKNGEDGNRYPRRERRKENDGIRQAQEMPTADARHTDIYRSTHPLQITDEGSLTFKQSQTRTQEHLGRMKKARTKYTGNG